MPRKSRQRSWLQDATLAFIDVETTGLDPGRHEILEIAILKGNLEWCAKVAPAHIERAHPRALEVNGYTSEKWAGAKPFRDVARTVQRLLGKGTLAVAHNAAFDKAFVLEALAKAHCDEGVTYHWLDTVSYAFEHLTKDGLEGLGLAKVCTHLGISNEGAHTALADARRCKLVYERLCA